ncbi:hypothetical protein HELRODRAFT_66091 [Helobdella robusta]|uniref:RRM domain-containing protein n=1 Tax=Helobdella robusta TaxID=6412 RepID=T1FYG9_HELRO|nr:hypothetical protein HELRODRAFT_66091 [Helobdella robusta]ESO02582.1 hypothetical protein HELRODRAFT_66091 [Helobdella robusta]
MSSKNHKTSSDYKRIFILGAKELSSADLRAEFERFGTIVDIRMLKNGDRENKGLNYITFTKASEAALAIDEMNGKRIKDLLKPIRVVLANDKTEGSVRDPDEDEKMKRLFIVVPQEQDQKDLEREFSKYGDIEYVKLLRRNQSNVQLAYVKFLKAYHAALALEECDPAYKAVFADTAWSSKRGHSGDRSRYESDSKYSRNSGGSSGSHQTVRGLSNPNKGGLVLGSSGYGGIDCRLEAKLVPHMTPEQVYKLFDVVPGLVYCNYDSITGSADIKYISQSMANHAREKLNLLEYPLGYPIISGLAAPILGSFLGSSGLSGHEAKYSNLSLPAPKPLAPENSQCVDRLFIVSYPSKIPGDVLTDLFCRFGGLISVFYLPNKKCGFAKFTTSESAQEALRTLHMQTICGCTLKVIQAEPQTNSGSSNSSSHHGFSSSSYDSSTSDAASHGLSAKSYKLD